LRLLANIASPLYIIVAVSRDLGVIVPWPDIGA
jgi:hypothetical protein